MASMDNIIDLTPNISVITKIEVLSFNAPSEHYTLLVDFINDAVIWDLTIPVVDETISIRKAHIIKLPDAIIAATAVSNNFKLITRNTSDFKNITGLQVLNFHDL